jgi:ComF family protein
MEWSCRLNGSEIQVSFGRYPKGTYQLLQEPYCKFCAHPNTTTEDCTWHHSLNGFERIYAIGSYFPKPAEEENDLLSCHIQRFKHMKGYADPLGKGLELVMREVYPELLGSEIIVPVPLHAEKLAERGYNQSLELSNAVGAHLQIPVEEVLQKTRNVDMRSLTWKERHDAVNGLYSLQPDTCGKIYGKKVLLIDDVVTTGLTVTACAELLNIAEVASVNVLVAGRTVKRES